MIAFLKRGDVTEEPAEALVYSTNVSLNCSGGVGSCLLARYGGQVQASLHGVLAASGRRFANRGEWFQFTTPGMPYRAVFHTVPCDGWYETTPAIVEGILRECLAECLRLEIRQIACAALATGYGHLPLENFFRVAARIVPDPEFAGLSSVTFCLADEGLFIQASELIRSEALPISLMN